MLGDEGIQFGLMLFVVVSWFGLCRRKLHVDVSVAESYFKVNEIGLVGFAWMRSVCLVLHENDSALAKV